MDEQGHIKELLINKTRRLYELQKQQALRGYDTSPHILIEIEDLERDLKELQQTIDSLLSASAPRFIEIEPRVFIIQAKKWVDQSISLTNLSTNVCRHIELTLDTAWPANLAQKKWAIDNLDNGASQKINLELKMDVECTKSLHPVQVKLRADHHLPQTTTLWIFAIEEVQQQQQPQPQQKRNPPSVSEFNIELRKLTDAQFTNLSYEQAFADLADTLIDPMMTPSRKIEKIITFCRNREKFPQLDQALRKILGSEYRSNDRNP